MRSTQALLFIIGIAAVNCASSQSTTSAGPTHANHPVADVDASATANPCANLPRPPERLPDGGINPEACIGQCSLVPHRAGTAANSAGDAASGEAPPTGTLDLRRVDAALRREARSLRECYDTAVMNHPWLASQGGTVNVHFIIELTGRVRGHPTASGLDEVPDVANCLEARIRYIVFPVPEGGPAEISVPFNFAGGT